MRGMSREHSDHSEIFENRLHIDVLAIDSCITAKNNIYYERIE